MSNLTLKNLCEKTGFAVTGNEKKCSFQTRVRGVNVNLEGNEYAVFLGEFSHLIDEIETLVISSNFKVKRKNLKGVRIHGWSNDFIEGYSILLRLIDDCEIEGLGFGRFREPLFVDGVRKQNSLAMASAHKIKVLLDNKMGHLIRHAARVILYADDQDHFITHAVSKKGQDYREHVIPCILIAQQAAKLTSEGCNEEKVASFIENHLVIVRISKSEANLLDYELGLKDKMPPDWSWGDNIYARLEVADIELVAI